MLSLVDFVIMNNRSTDINNNNNNNILSIPQSSTNDNDTSTIIAIRHPVTLSATLAKSYRRRSMTTR